MNASPYLFFNCPLQYSSVCSSAMFMYPSRQVRTPGKLNFNYHFSALLKNLASVVHARVELDHDWSANDLLEKIIWILSATHDDDDVSAGVSGKISGNETIKFIGLHNNNQASRGYHTILYNSALLFTPPHFHSREVHHLHSSTAQHLTHFLILVQQE